MQNVAHEKWLQKSRFYQHIGIYAYKTETLHQIAKMQPSALEQAESLEQLRWLENGLSIRMAVVGGDSISIDTPDDLAKAIEMAR
jgi:3-deoxy-manno-octulosonate cytidylyltransferase (CMP-KDO synthetase)